MGNDTEISKEQFRTIIDKLIFKTTEINAMMKRGEFIIAYEKLGGVLKVLQRIHTDISSENQEETRDKQA